MQLTTILILALCLQVSAGVNAQITLTAKDEPLQKVFKQIEKQSGYEFLYGVDVVKQAGKVTLSLKNVTIQQALDACLDGKELTYEIDDKTVIIKRKSPPSPVFRLPSPPITVKGKVVNEDGEPVEGVTVKIKNSDVGTSTNALGEFFLSDIPENATLVFSSTNIETQELKLNKRSALTVSIKRKVSILDEVQIIPYGTVTNRLNTGNTATVKAKDIEKQPVNNPLLALQGRVPGLFITQTNGLAGSGIVVRIQGQNSIRNGNTPLYVVDGVPFITQIPGGELGPIGSSGEIQGGLSTGFGNALRFINPADIESIDILKDADATAIYGSRAANGAILITTKKGKAGKTKFDLNLQQGLSQVSKKMKLLNTEQYLEMRNEAYKNDGTTPSLNGFPAAYDLLLWDTTRYTDWQKTLIGGKAQYTNINANISGGTQSVRYLIGGTFHRETTIYPGNFSDQNGSVHLNLNNTSNNQKFHFNVSASYLVDNNQLPVADLTNYIYLEPNAPALYIADGTLNWASDASGVSSWTNPLAGAFYSTYQAKTNNLMSSAKIGYMLLPGLELSSSLGYTKIQSNVYQPNSLLALAPEIRPYGSRTATYQTSNVNTWIIEPQATYKTNVGKGKLDVLLGSTFQQSASHVQGITGYGYMNDLVLRDPGSALSISAGSFENLYKYAALFGRGNYNWREKYIINLTARRDGSSRFGDKNKFHNFGAVGAAWIFTQEPFVQRALSFLSFGKFRASYGTTGSDQVGNYSFLNLYGRVPAEVPYQASIGFEPRGLSNPYLQWEETRKWQMGLDFGFIQDRILLTVGYARNRCSNQLLGYALPAITGSTSIIKNFPATLQNTSWEFSVNSTIIKSTDFEWTSNVNLTMPQNKLVSFPNLATSSYAYQYNIGQDINTWRVLHFIGVNPATGVYEVASKTDPSNPALDDYNVFISLSPKFHGGFQNNLQYKGFQLDLLFQFVKRLGNWNRFSNGKGAPPGSFFLSGSHNQPANVLDRWRKPGDNTTIQKFSSGFDLGPLGLAAGSDAVYTDASYLRLTNLSLSWELPANWKQKAHLQNARIYVQAQNLVTITKYKGLDPETGTSVLPPLRVITVGLQIGM